MRRRASLAMITCCALLVGSCTSDEDGQPAAQPDPSPTAIQVPDVTGLKLKYAEELLQETDLRIGRISRRADGTRNKVLEQRPYPGIQVSPGKAVNLVLSKIFPVPALTIPKIGTFGWTCKGDRSVIVLTMGLSATTVIDVTLPDGRTIHGTRHPEGTLEAPPLRSGRQVWVLSQATEPQTLKARVSVIPRERCSSYLLPKMRLTMRSHSHSVVDI